MTNAQSSSHVSNRPPNFRIHMKFMTYHIKDLAALLENIIDQTRDGAYSSDRLIVVVSDIASAINEIANSMILRIVREEEEAQK